MAFGMGTGLLNRRAVFFAIAQVPPVPPHDRIAPQASPVHDWIVAVLLDLHLSVIGLVQSWICAKLWPPAPGHQLEPALFQVLVKMNKTGELVSPCRAHIGPFHCDIQQLRVYIYIYIVKGDLAGSRMDPDH